jgi:N-acetyl-gamma-glutamyl-phosphate/LysW-gamma-L-alpha-aminoadipyl-6-phosphate reductase
VEVVAVTSERNVGKFVHQVHPHLRGQSTLRFISRDALPNVDVLFLAMPHGIAQQQINHYANLAERIIDLSADFRLSDADAYASAYGEAHQAPDWLARFVYGLPELNREALRGAQYASGVGCNATATNLALWALVQGGLLELNQPLVADLKVGSSEAGNAPSESSHHPVRSGIVRPYRLTGHRHEAEVRQIFAAQGDIDVRMVVTSVEMVRGAAAAVHVTLPTGLPKKTSGAAIAPPGTMSRLYALCMSARVSHGIPNRVCWRVRITRTWAGPTIPTPGARCCSAQLITWAKARRAPRCSA